MKPSKRLWSGLKARKISLPAALILSLVMVFVVGVGAFAGRLIVSPDPSTGLIHGCYNNHSGTINIVTASDKCHDGETSSQWSKTNPTGSQNPATREAHTGPKVTAGPHGRA